MAPEAEEQIGGFRSTVQGQASGLRAVMERLTNVPNGRGTGHVLLGTGLVCSERCWLENGRG